MGYSNVKTNDFLVAVHSTHSLSGLTSPDPTHTLYNGAQSKSLAYRIHEHIRVFFFRTTSFGVVFYAENIPETPFIKHMQHLRFKVIMHVEFFLIIYVDLISIGRI